MHSPGFRGAPAVAAVALLLHGCGGGGGGITTPPPGGNPPPSGSDIDVAPVFANLTFSSPLLMLQSPGDDTRWYVVEQGGMVRVFDADNAVSSSSVFADLSGRVDSSQSESGLLGMAFHPDFATNGEVYLSYTRGGPLTSVVSRFVIDAGGQTLDEGSEEILLTLPQPAGNHNGGNVVFGPDGNLFVGFGDGGGSGDPDNNGQNTHNLYGTIVRIGVDVNTPYTIPASNPFSGETECAQGSGTSDCPEIYAWGFRNPWRYSFDRQTGELWVADVGQGAWEEVDRVEGGMNYGWRQREGAHCFNPSSGCSTTNVDPIAEYDHTLGSSITGGYVYRGSTVTALAGEYVFGDFGSGRIFTVPAGSAQGTAVEERLDTNLGISSFGQGNDGELYVVDYSGGKLYQVVAAP